MSLSTISALLTTTTTIRCYCYELLFPITILLLRLLLLLYTIATTFLTVIRAIRIREASSPLDTLRHGLNDLQYARTRVDVFALYLFRTIAICWRWQHVDSVSPSYTLPPPRAEHSVLQLTIFQNGKWCNASLRKETDYSYTTHTHIYIYISRICMHINMYSIIARKGVILYIYWAFVTLSSLSLSYSSVFSVGNVAFVFSLSLALSLSVSLSFGRL